MSANICGRNRDHALKAADGHYHEKIIGNIATPICCDCRNAILPVPCTINDRITTKEHWNAMPTATKNKRTTKRAAKLGRGSNLLAGRKPTTAGKKNLTAAEMKNGAAKKDTPKATKKPAAKSAGRGLANQPGFDSTRSYAPCSECGKINTMRVHNKCGAHVCTNCQPKHTCKKG